MPITFDEYQGGEARDASAIPSTRADVLWETFAQAYESNPLKAISRYHELSVDEKTGPRLDAVSARQKLTDAGFENELTVGDAGITQAALDTLMERKRVERRRNDIFSRAQGGLVEGTEKFGLSIATSLADPVGAGLNFVPIVGQTRYYSLMARASFARRAAIRAGVGAIEGTVGGAIAEVPVYAMRTSEQADFDMGDALLDVAFGGITGAGLHTTVGNLAEGIDLIRGRTPEFSLYRDLNGEQIEALRAAPAATRQQLAKLFSTAAPAKREFDGIVSAIANDAGTADVKFGKLKGVPRALEKSIADYGGDASQLKDLVRATIVVDSLDQAGRVVDAAKSRLGALSKLKDKLRDNTRVGADGYRDINIVATVGGQQVELQVNVREMAEAKNGAGHKLYEQQREIEALAKKEGREITDAEAAKLADLQRQQRELYQAAFEAFEARSRNSASDTSVPLWPKDENGNVRPDGTSQAVARPARADTGTSSTSANSVPSGNLAGRDISITSGRSIPVDQSVRDFDLTAQERAGLATPAVREAALRAAVGQAVSGNPINVDPIFANDAKAALAAATSTRDGVPNREYTAADKHAEETLALEQTDRLKAAQEVTQLAIADAKALQKRLGIEEEDAELTAAAEGVKTAERWAQAAEIASTCLLRGG